MLYTEVTCGVKGVGEAGASHLAGLIRRHICVILYLGCPCKFMYMFVGIPIHKYVRMIVRVVLRLAHSHAHTPRSGSIREHHLNLAWRTIAWYVITTLQAWLEFHNIYRL